MKLYFSPGSCGLAAQIALREAGVPFDLVKVDFATKRTVDGDYLQVNPKGFIPALEWDDGAIVTEGAVILQWIADHHPDARLLPPVGTVDRYRAMEWLNYVATDLHKGMAVMFSTLVDGDSKVRFAEGNLALRFAYVDDHLATNDYVLGDRFSAVDTYLYNVLRWPPRVNIDISAYAAIQSFMRRMEQRPSVVASVAAELSTNR
ncbi:MAG: Glutathione S-transferase GST-6.0 [Luteibacter sp.]|uniref:glutathione transferase GstA n=1 Tax=Luteibacter sp. TaxID=1886636 RepID=UPI00137C964B|nr:glutathione transferase GstA [Luteibacter sp.]KAF1007773.1 MAG: Glutathione S-transferase GST-6.0 [Luteibacter sp.]